REAVLCASGHARRVCETNRNNAGFREMGAAPGIFENRYLHQTAGRKEFADAVGSGAKAWLLGHPGAGCPKEWVTRHASRAMRRAPPARGVASTTAPREAASS